MSEPSLIHEAIRVFEEVKALCPDVRTEFIVENVASMDVDVRDEISRLLQVIPYRLNPVNQVPNSRPRFCWTSVTLPRHPTMLLQRRNGYINVEIDGQWPEPSQWLSPGWEQADPSAIYPTFMKAIVRTRAPPMPAGLARADSSCRSRWESHSFRYPPYQYRSEFLVFHPDEESGRLLNADERELLMGYGKGHTLMCASASNAKANLQAYEDERCSLVGDSFSIWSFCLFSAAAVPRCCLRGWGFHQAVLSVSHIRVRYSGAKTFLIKDHSRQWPI